MTQFGKGRNPTTKKYTIAKRYKHPAQKSYVTLCGESKVKPIASLTELLGYGVVWAELDDLGVEKLQTIGKLVKLGESTEITEIHLACGLKYATSKSKSGRTVKRKYKKVSVIANPKENSLLCRSIGHGIKCNPMLTTLELIGTKITVASMRSLASGISASTSMRHLSIQGSKCGDDAFMILASAIGKSRSINDVCANGCNLSSDARSGITGMIRAHAQIRNDERWTLNLRNIPGMVHDIPLLGLLTLDLSQNQLGDLAACDIAQALMFDDWLVGLNLSSNRIGAKGANALHDLVCHSNDGVTIIDLRDNKDSSFDSCLKIDQALSCRDVLSNDGKLSPQTQSADALEIVCEAILKWECGHQLNENARDLVAKITASTQTLTMSSNYTARSALSIMHESCPKSIGHIGSYKPMTIKGPQFINANSHHHRQNKVFDHSPEIHLNVESFDYNLDTSTLNKTQLHTSIMDNLVGQADKKKLDTINSNNDVEPLDAYTDFYNLKTEGDFPLLQEELDAPLDIPTEPSHDDPYKSTDMLGRSIDSASSGYNDEFLYTFKSQLKKSISEAAKSSKNAQVSAILLEAYEKLNDVLPCPKPVSNVQKQDGDKIMQGLKKKRMKKLNQRPKSANAAKSTLEYDEEDNASFSKFASMVSEFEECSRSKGRKGRKLADKQSDKSNSHSTMCKNFLDLEIQEAIALPRNGKNSHVNDFQISGYEEEVSQ